MATIIKQIFQSGILSVTNPFTTINTCPAIFTQITNKYHQNANINPRRVNVGYCWLNVARRPNINQIGNTLCTAVQPYHVAIYIFLNVLHLLQKSLQSQNNTKNKLKTQKHSLSYTSGSIQNTHASIQTKKTNKHTSHTHTQIQRNPKIILHV